MKFLNYLFIALVALTATSCMSYSKLQYVKNSENAENLQLESRRTSKTIKPFDELYVKILSTDEKTARIFSAESTMAGNNDTHLVSYTVNEDGDILFPFVGKISVKEMTLEQASEKIQKSLSQYLLNTAVRVRFINNHITVIGEVNSAGEFTFTTDKVSIFQAIGMAGGINNYGSRKNVTIIRVINDKATYNQINLGDKNVVQSPYYFIEPNDVVVVKPHRAIINTFQNNTYSTVLTTLTTLLTIIVAIRSF
ncbi:MAG: hypothetical protein HC830_00675 [Bacteroidetes bacterium]|nr:hypothetical protein [Bacteroidota bacterium]